VARQQEHTLRQQPRALGRGLGAGNGVLVALQEALHGVRR